MVSTSRQTGSNERRAVIRPPIGSADGAQRAPVINPAAPPAELMGMGMGMELRQIEHFLAVVEEASVTNAAASLHLERSRLSASLSALERELGCDLLIRSGRGTELTDAGWAFLEPARAALQDADRARDAVAEVHGTLRGSIRIATAAVPPRLDVAHTIRQFQEEHPDVDVQVVPAGAKRAAELVAEGRVDFAITPLTHRLSASVRFEPLVSTPLVVACPTGHRLAGTQDLDPRELVDEPIIDLPRGWWLRDLFDRMLDERGLFRRARFEVDDWFGVLSMVQRGMGISYAPQACIDGELFSEIHVATLADAPMWDIGIASRPAALRGAAGRAFLAAYREQCDATA
jgi:DNA-binding transcriptional LysR family regulator